MINDSVACVASDERAKNITSKFTGALDEINKIEPILYTYKPEFNGSYQTNPNFNGQQLGLGAKALQEIDPRLVSVYTEDGDNGLFEYKKGEASGPKEYALVTLALGGVKELNQKIEGIQLGKVARGTEENYQWIIIALMFLWIIRLEFKKK